MVALILALTLHANPYLPKAMAQVRALDEQAALETLTQAKNWPRNTPSELAQVHLWFGLAYAGLVREEEARESFRAALLIDNSLELPSGTSPVVIAWWTASGGRVAKPSLVPVATKPGPDLAGGPPPEPEKPKWKPWAGVAVSAVAAAALGAGIYFGVQAKNLRTTAENTPRAAAADALNREAVATAQRANWFLGGGGVGALAGAALFVF